MANVLSDKSGSVLAAITQKGQQFASDVGKATDEALKSIEDKGLGFTRAVMDNGTEITRMISDAGEAATKSVNRSLDDLHNTAQKAIELSKSTATATVSEMMETHNMLRADTTALFERLREANIMLQEVLSGSHANMSALENTLVLRVSEFVKAMTEVTSATGAVTDRVETNVADFREVTTRAVTDLAQIATQFEAHGRDLAGTAEQIERSNKRTEDGVNERRVTIKSLVATLDSRTEDLDQRLKRFSSLLDESLEAASARARDIARVVSDSTAEGSRAISEQYEQAREGAENLARLVSESGAEGTRAIGEQYERVREGGTWRVWCRRAAPKARARSASSTSACASQAERRLTAEAMRSSSSRPPATPMPCSATPTSVSPRPCRA